MKYLVLVFTKGLGVNRMVDNLKTAALTGDAALPFNVNPYSEARCNRMFQDILEEPP